MAKEQVPPFVLSSGADTVEAAPKTPSATDGVAFARLYGEPLFDVPDGLYIPPDALEVFLESFEGPLDLLLYLIRKQRFDIMDIPMAIVTEQYMQYVELIHEHNLELAAAYLEMAAYLLDLKSRLLVPVPKADVDDVEEDPQAALSRRLLEYEKMKMAAVLLGDMPQQGRDFWRAFSGLEAQKSETLPDLSGEQIAEAWAGLLQSNELKRRHHVARQELSVREYMSRILKKLGEAGRLEFRELLTAEGGTDLVLVNYLAILELGKEGLVVISQQLPFAPLYVESTQGGNLDGSLLL